MRKTLMAVMAAVVPWIAGAQEPLKIGLVAPYSGPQATYGPQMEAGMKAWLKIHGDSIAGRKVVIIPRDNAGPNPESAKRLSQELVTRDKVDFLAGYGFTPDAIAAAPIATEAKVPMVIMNAASSIVTTKSPYIVRFSDTLQQVSAPMGTWAAKNGIRKVYTLVSDYAPGIDSETAFKKAFEAGGGQVVDSVRVPLRNPDFAPYVQRIKDARPDAVFMFVPAGEQGIAFMKAFDERGLAKAGIKVIATGDLTDDEVVNTMGDAVLGVITSHHYSAAHDSPENKQFLAAYAQVKGSLTRANFFTVGGYDGMAAMAEVTKRLGGKIDGDKAMEAFRGMKLASPRGAISIDPATRDIVQTIYIRRVEKKGNDYWNVEFDRFPDVKDPGK